MDFSPRLKQILFLLLNTEEPIPASTLAEQLQLSKRTVFREIEHVNSQLEAYHVQLHTKSKKGFYLVGEKADKEQLLETLSSSEYLDPFNREDRHKRLILELLKQDEPQKIFYFSEMLKVSEGTVNNDLDLVEQWFLESDIQLVRKPGLGVYLEYLEENYRKSCIRFIYQNMDVPNIQKALLNNEVLYYFSEQDIVNKVIDATSRMDDKKIKAMTENSYLGFILYLSIMIKRILVHKEITTKVPLSETDKTSETYQFVLSIIELLKSRFLTDIRYNEIPYLFVYIKGIRLQYISDSAESTDQYFDITCLIYKMIHQYDPTIAYQLKQDEIFIKGLIAHLTPTLVRLQYNIEIHNPFQQEIETLYPDILSKTKHAVKVMGQVEEIGLISNEIGSVLQNFGVYHVDPAIGLNDIVLYVSNLLGDNDADSRYIYEDLLKREALSTQVIPEYDFVLLHSKSKGVKYSKFIVVLPDGSRFTDPYFLEVRAVVVMIIPPEDPRETLAIASISSALFEEASFLNDIKQGKDKKIKTFIEQRLKQYLLERISDIQP